MKGSVKLFTIFGIDIKLHFSWWFVFFLLVWILSSSVFPTYSPGLAKSVYWFMGTVAALLLFISVLLHELSHSLVAKAKRIRVESITLFFFGGVAGITKENMKPSSEFLMAIAGPLFSFLLAGIFYLINISNGNVVWNGITTYLWQINLILAIFNMIPGFPLDGGRAFRAVLYWYYKDLKKATKIAVAGGKFFAGFLFFLGIFALISGMNGLWFILLGGFLYFIAGMSYDQVIIQDVLSKVPVKKMIKKEIVYLNPEMKFADFVKKYVNTDQDIFLLKDKNIVKVLNLNNVGNMAPKMQELVRLKQLSLPLKQIKNLSLHDNAYTAFRKFAEQGTVIIPVIEKGQLLGFVTKKQLMRYLVWSLKFGDVLNADTNGKKTVLKKKKVLDKR